MNEFINWGKVRRVGAAALVVVVGLGLTGCTGRGGGNLSPDLSGSSSGDATFGFTFRCENSDTGPSMVEIQLSYRDSGLVVAPPVGSISLHGTAAATQLKEGVNCEVAGNTLVEGNDTLRYIFEAGTFNVDGAAVFSGCYRPTSDTGLYPPVSDVCSPASDGTQGNFIVAIEDNGASSRTFEGDRFFIQLHGGPYSGYTREGEVERGNIQVDQ